MVSLGRYKIINETYLIAYPGRYALCTVMVAAMEAAIRVLLFTEPYHRSSMKLQFYKPCECDVLPQSNRGKYQDGGPTTVTSCDSGITKLRWCWTLVRELGKMQLLGIIGQLKSSSRKLNAAGEKWQASRLPDVG